MKNICIFAKINNLEMRKFLSRAKLSSLVLVVSSSLFLMSCDENSSTKGDYNAMVVGFSPKSGCGETEKVFVIKLMPGTAGIPANEDGNLFYEINLPSQFEKPNYPINAKFRLATQAEVDQVSSACTEEAPLQFIYIESATEAF